MPLPSYWWRQNFRGGCAQQRLETVLPSESPTVFPLYQWHWQILDRAERCCHCLGFSSGPSLWLCWWHCSHFKHSLGFRVSLQLQLNKFHNYTRFRGLKLNTDKTKIMVFFSNDTSAIPTFTYDGTPLELVTHSNTLDSVSLVMEVCTQQLRRWQTIWGSP